MSNSPTKYVADWFARADDDLVLVKLILEQGTGSSNLACFHAQQAAEKYLKGFLAHHELHVRKVHDVEVLAEDCKKIDVSFAQVQDDARFLNQFYIESRYPDDFISFERSDAERSLDVALRIKEFVLARIRNQGQKGFGITAIIVILAVAALAGAGLWYARTVYRPAPSAEKPTRCTAEVKQCPDGFYVSRTGPNCEFAKCPELKTNQNPLASSSASSVDISTWKTYRNEKYGFEVRYPEEWSTRGVDVSEDRFGIDLDYSDGSVHVAFLPRDFKPFRGPDITYYKMRFANPALLCPEGTLSYDKRGVFAYVDPVHISFGCSIVGTQTGFYMLRVYQNTVEFDKIVWIKSQGKNILGATASIRLKYYDHLFQPNGKFDPRIPQGYAKVQETVNELERGIISDPDTAANIKLFDAVISTLKFIK